MALRVRVGGKWADMLGYAGPVTYSTRWPIGCWEATWEMDLAPDFTDTAARPSSTNRVEIFWGALRLWVGWLSEVERGGRGEPWRFTAFGLARLANRYVALDDLGVPTSSASHAVTEAVVRGLPWQLPTLMPTWAPLTTDEETVKPNRLGDLLDAAAEENGQKWAVFGDGIFTFGTDATAAAWGLTPDVGMSSTTDEEYRTHIYARRVSSESGTPPRPDGWETELVARAAPLGRYEDYLDLTGRGLMSEAQALGAAQGVLDSTGQRMAYVAPFEGTTVSLTSLGGIPAELALVRAGQAVTIWGLLDSLGNPAFGASTVITLGEVTYTDGDDTIRLAPVGMAARDVSSIIAEASKPPEGFQG